MSIETPLGTADEIGTGDGTGTTTVPGFPQLELVRETVGGREYCYYPLGRFVVSAPGVCGGRPVFKWGVDSERRPR